MYSSGWPENVFLLKDGLFYNPFPPALNVSLLSKAVCLYPNCLIDTLPPERFISRKKKKKKGKERSTWCGKRAVQQGWCLLSPYSATLNVFSNYSSLKEKVTLIWINRVAIGEMSWFKKKIKKFRNNLICNKYIITLWKLSLV